MEPASHLEGSAEHISACEGTVNAIQSCTYLRPASSSLARRPLTPGEMHCAGLGSLAAVNGGE